MKTECRLGSLCKYDSFVPNEINLKAKLIVIAQNPGQTEVQLGKPLVGKSGIAWEEAINSIGLKREDFSIYNAILCKGKFNDPIQEDIRAYSCFTYLRKALLENDNNIIWCMGKLPALFFRYGGQIINQDIVINTTEATTGRAFKVLVTPHPSYLLRNNIIDKLRDYVRRYQSLFW